MWKTSRWLGARAAGHCCSWNSRYCPTIGDCVLKMITVTKHIAVLQTRPSNVREQGIASSITMIIPTLPPQDTTHLWSGVQMMARVAPAQPSPAQPSGAKPRPQAVQQAATYSSDKGNVGKTADSCHCCQYVWVFAAATQSQNTLLQKQILRAGFVNAINPCIFCHTQSTPGPHRLAHLALAAAPSRQGAIEVHHQEKTLHSRSGNIP
jgi:hypothetical protein